MTQQTAGLVYVDDQVFPNIWAALGYSEAQARKLSVAADTWREDSRRWAAVAKAASGKAKHVGGRRVFPPLRPGQRPYKPVVVEVQEVSL